MLLQPRVQMRLLTLPVIKKRAVAVNLRIFAFTDLRANQRAVQFRVQLGAWAVLDGVIRPPHLG